MDTPVCDFVRAYAQTGGERLHMPGHKGIGPLGVEALDITEVDGADELYRPDGILLRSQENAARLFGAAQTVYSAEGSSLAIRAMVYLTALYAKAKGETPRIAASRNAHRVFMTATALLDVEVDWLFPKQWEGVVSCRITARELEEYLAQVPQRPTAVYITSPDYLGHVADIRAMAQVCRSFGVLLLVDNAHGAYLRFLPEDVHPLTLGADLCCDSAHKTLTVLTGGAYLHFGETAPELMVRQARTAMELFASTSPSYLILQSLDAANAYLAEGYGEKLANAVERIGQLKSQISMAQVGREPLKLTLAPKSYGYLGTELAELLQEKGIVCEFADPDFVTMMLSPEMTEGDFARLQTTLCAVERKEPIFVMPPPIPKAVRCMTPKEALFTPSRDLPVRDCLGKILASACVTCPPAIPVLVCGEQINEEAVACFEYYGIAHCRVLCAKSD